MPPTPKEMLTNALKLYIIATFNQDDWVRVALETDTLQVVQRDDRLFKALSWGDADYSAHAVARADDILGEVWASQAHRPPSDRFASELDEVQRVFPSFYGWAHQNKPRVASLFETTGSTMSEAELDHLLGADTRLELTKSTKAPREVLLESAGLVSSNPLVTPIAPRSETPPVDKLEIFLVHGHDHVGRDEISSFIRQVTGIEPTILSEQPNGGMTIIEKFELHANAAAIAVVLLTPDDFGAANGQSPAGRARQNVIFEMGYFTGRLSRKQVIPLDAGVEQPSDVGGLLYIPFDGGWKPQLRVELAAAGVPIIG